MALPTLADKIDAVEDKIEKESIISEIAKAVFKSAKISMESAAKAVVPSVPEMVNEILDDLKSGSIQKFNLAMDKLDKLVKTLGIDLKKYNKELANFAVKREQKIIQSEEKIQTLRENNIIAEIEKSGDIRVLSQNEIEKKQKALKDAEDRIKELEKKIAKDTKQIQDPGLFDKKLKTTAQFNKKEEIKKDVKELEQKKKERDQAKGILGERGEQQPGILQRGREGLGNFVEEYVPQPIADVGNAMVEGFMAPINAVKDLGKSFGQLLKPLKLLRPLFTGLLGSLKKFALGLKAGFIAMLPQIALGAVILTVLGLIYLAITRIRDFLDKFKGTPGSEMDISGEADHFGIGNEDNVAKEGDMSSKVMRKGFHADTGDNKMEFIKPDDPRYDDLYMQKYGKEAPKKGEVFIEGERKILPLTDDGQLIKSGNFMENRSKQNLRSPDNLKPISYKEKEQKINSVIDSSVKNFSSNNTTVAGLNGPRDMDMEIFYITHPMYR